MPAIKHMDSTGCAELMARPSNPMVMQLSACNRPQYARYLLPNLVVAGNCSRYPRLRWYERLTGITNLLRKSFLQIHTRIPLLISAAIPRAAPGVAQLVGV